MIVKHDKNTYLCNGMEEQPEWGFSILTTQNKEKSIINYKK